MPVKEHHEVGTDESSHTDTAVSSHNCNNPSDTACKIADDAHTLARAGGGSCSAEDACYTSLTGVDKVVTNMVVTKCFESTIEAVEVPGS